MNENKQSSKTAVIYVRSAMHNQEAEALQTGVFEKLAESLKCEVVATFTDWGCIWHDYRTHWSAGYARLH